MGVNARTAASRGASPISKSRIGAFVGLLLVRNLNERFLPAASLLRTKERYIGPIPVTIVPSAR
jgi:hypothetical protein